MFHYPETIIVEKLWYFFFSYMKLIFKKIYTIGQYVGLSKLIHNSMHLPRIQLLNQISLIIN